MLLSVPAMMPRLALQSLFLAAAVAAAAVYAGSGAAAMAAGGSGEGEETAGPRNVLGGELSVCSTDPMTGFTRCVLLHVCIACVARLCRGGVD